jgi:hypothetical protein
MFEHRKYVSQRSLDRLVASGFIENLHVTVMGYNQKFEQMGAVMIRRLNPYLSIKYINCDKDEEELRCVLLKNTYKITTCLINGVVQDR